MLKVTEPDRERERERERERKISPLLRSEIRDPRSEIGPPSAPRAIIFDFDGVIADTEPFHFATFQQTLAEEGIHVEESRDLERFLGLNDRAAFRKAFREAGRKLGPAACRDLVERKSVYYCRRLPEVRLFKGVKRLLSALEGRLPLAIASGGRTGEIELILANHEIRRYFSAVVSADEVPRSKPFPDSYLRALEALGVRGLRPVDCLAIEDSVPGIRAALAAGMSCLAVAHTWPLSSLTEADRAVAKLADVTARDLLGSRNGSGTGTGTGTGAGRQRLPSVVRRPKA